MAFDFPSAPTLNQVYTYAGKSWKWNGEGWALLTNSLSSLLLNEGSFTVTVAPTTLTGNQTQTIQNATGTVALSSNKLSFFAATTSAELAGVISDETGSGLLVFDTSPSFTTSITTASTTFALVNATATTVNFAGAATALNVGAAGCLTIFGGEVRPVADNTYDLGDPSFRWANIYTGDLHLKNDRGDYTIVEEEDALTLRNNKTGKVYNFVLEERKA